MTDHAPEAAVPADIVAALIEVRGRAYVPYSDHPVGALLITQAGNRYVGANVEVAHYKGLCAEASAIAAMISAGETRLQEVYVIGPGSHLCTPCGDCRQRLREFASPQTVIRVVDADGQLLKRYTMDELLPDSFGPENLGKGSAYGS
ncbi:MULTISPECIES: cytidine deaminase [Halomonas]|uniref:cytidine deaminase n=1 Tax=Halomonas TaxID=2745 RepID=UPI001A8D4D16|nr:MULTISPECIES: cytidine deaminase [Halomonas]MBN8413245.1 cytidine deaminase [Halomonas litopenaei]MBY5967115.1 cytidine deaminase [Halomonas denitrificans]MBY6208862.1 cytidine deaminase [Halomonas sp. DP3Y7-2]MBY6227332.1 cytidine deaminase [Halomonas sp. DP3Y7-1]MCA0914918.1 cytidine deaminase [Halomonas denitrificans]